MVGEPRQADIGATLMLTARILLSYMQEVMALNDSQSERVKQQWAEALVGILRHSEEETVALDPVRMYLEALFSLHSAGRIQIAPNQASARPGQHIGFVKEGCWWLLPDEVYADVLHYWNTQQERFPLTKGKAHALLAQAGIINTAQENRNGKIKTLYGIKSTWGDRPRMLVLRVEQARAYIEED